MKGLGAGVVAVVAVFWSCTTAAGSDTPVQSVIKGDVRWRGEVSVDGIAIVTREGRLTIEAGTTVRFLQRDDDGDGIGDSELRVEGVLRVEGTPDRPVLFTSAAARPAPADWKYIMINHGRDAAVSNAVVEYAFSGVQIHYTRGTFRGLVSRHNVDGFRFSTAPVVLEDSLLTRNENGIRFEERGAGASVRGNIVTDNRFGLFAVIKCEGLSVMENNLFENNSEYNVKMGERQTTDLPLSCNWWGTSLDGEIRASFFDGRMEPGLGRVLYEPYLKERPTLAKSP
ncbi:MAG: right-handed parallel beta-helix repeat-containing protein [bacterium]|nr:MAG: right-handed parallel beta-helix repeat-containing protein [bacterium]